jgi:hypothetical protein
MRTIGEIELIMSRFLQYINIASQPFVNGMDLYFSYHDSYIVVNVGNEVIVKALSIKPSAKTGSMKRICGSTKDYIHEIRMSDLAHRPRSSWVESSNFPDKGHTRESFIQIINELSRSKTDRERQY